MYIYNFLLFIIIIAPLFTFGEFAPKFRTWIYIRFPPNPCVVYSCKRPTVRQIIRHYNLVSSDGLILLMKWGNHSLSARNVHTILSRTKLERLYIQKLGHQGTYIYTRHIRGRVGRKGIPVKHWTAWAKMWTHSLWQTRERPYGWGFLRYIPQLVCCSCVGWEKSQSYLSSPTTSTQPGHAKRRLSSSRVQCAVTIQVSKDAPRNDGRTAVFGAR